MTRQRLILSSIVALTCAGFAACTFGADDFDVVEADSSGAGNGRGGAGGTGEGGAGGSGTGGDAGGAGSGGAGTGGATPYVCAPLGDPFTVFSATDIANGSPNDQIGDQPVSIVSTGTNTAVVAVATTSGIMLRGISDASGGQVTGSIATVVYPGLNALLIGGMAADSAVLKILVGGLNGIIEHRFDMVQGGAQLSQQAATTNFPMPPNCDSTTGSTMKNLIASYQGNLSYVVSCVPPAGSASLYLFDFLSPLPTEIVSPQFEENSNLAYQYVKVQNQHVLLVGNPVGPSLSVRVGPDATALGDIGHMQLSTDPAVLSSMLLATPPDGAELFMVGAALIGAPAFNPAVVPAGGYAGTLADLTGIEVIPPDGIEKYAIFAEKSELYGLNGIAFVGENFAKTGVRSDPPDAIALSLFEPDGTVLARDAVVYATSGSVIDAKLSGAVAPLGVGSVVTWVENSEVRARVVTCVPNR